MIRRLIVLMVFVCVACALPAQDRPGIPKILVLDREEIKPGKVTAHTQEAHRFLQIAEKHQASVYRVGGMAMSGNTNEIFYLSFANSFADLERNADFPQAMQAELASFEAQSGDLHQSQRSIFAQYAPAMSYRPEAHAAAMNNAKRINLFILRTRPGTHHQVEEVGKMYVEGYRKAGITEDYWLAYAVRAGMPGGTWIFVQALASLAAWDADFEERFAKAAGEETMKKISSLIRDVTIAEDVVIIGVDPMVSRPTKEMLAANPSWWTPKNVGVTAGTKATPVAARKEKEKKQ